MIVAPLSPAEAAHRLLLDEDAHWTAQAAYALAVYLHDTSVELDEPYVCNPTAIRQEFVEYASATDAARHLTTWEDDRDAYARLQTDEEAEQDALGYLRYQTTVIPVPGGTRVVVQVF